VSAEQEYKCPKCGYEWETILPFNGCPRCKENNKMVTDKATNLLDSEIEFQRSHGFTKKGVSDVLIELQVLLTDALSAKGKGDYDLAAMAQVRKIAAVAALALEKFPTPPRNAVKQTVLD
jgi:phage FluMu protein Com